MLLVASSLYLGVASAFVPSLGRCSQAHHRHDASLMASMNIDDNDSNDGFMFDKNMIQKGTQVVATVVFGLSTLAAPSFATSTTTTESTYDGFADYAKDNQMEQSDVGCFINKCGEQTKNLFTNPRGIKGISCLGRCKGDQTEATRCFAEFGSKDLSNFLSCAIEENECMKMPKGELIDNTAEDVGYSSAPVQSFDPKSLVGTWYKTVGLNPNYDMFDCQTNVFTATSASDELDMQINLRIPSTDGGGFFSNQLYEHMIIDGKTDNNPSKRTMHTSGKMNGLSFYENWYILGESDGSKGIPEFKLVAFKGHSLQGNYEGSFVYAKERILPEAVVPAVREAATRAGLDFSKYKRIDNTCHAGEPLNDRSAAAATGNSDWVDLVVGEGGVIDWISPGWRGEYKK